MAERRTRRRRNGDDSSGQETEHSEPPSIASEQRECHSVGGVLASVPASAPSASRASASTPQVSADFHQHGSLTTEVQTHIAIAEMRAELRKDLESAMAATVLQALKAYKDNPSSPAPSLTSRQWTGTYAGQTGRWKQDSDSGSWTLVESLTPTKDPFQTPEGDPWESESAPSGISPGGVLASVLPRHYRRKLLVAIYHKLLELSE